MRNTGLVTKLNSGLQLMTEGSMDDMNREIAEFDSWCQAAWGTKARNHRKLLAPNTPQIREHVDFDKISPSLKSHIAKTLIIESCNRMGAFQESGDVTWYIHGFAREFQDDGRDFTGRRIQPPKAALFLLVHSRFSSALPRDSDDFDHILAGGAAISATYLLAQLEFLFRGKGRYLNEDGTIKHAIPVRLCNEVGLRPNLKPNTSDRVNGIDQAFKLYLYRNRTLVGKHLRILQKKLGIGERLKKIRHPVMHGELPDPTVEARFFALLIAMFYYEKG